MLLETILKIPSQKVDTVYVTRVDTVKMGSDTSIDLLTKVDVFYNNSFNTLLWTFGIIITIGCVVLPILLQTYHKQMLKRENDSLKAEILSENTTALDKLKIEMMEVNLDLVGSLKKEMLEEQVNLLTELKKEINDEISEAINKLNQENEKAIDKVVLELKNLTEYSLYHSQAATHYAVGRFAEAARDSMTALYHCLNANSSERDKNDELENVITALKKCDEKGFAKVDIVFLRDWENAKKSNWLKASLKASEINTEYDRLTKTE